jgi:protein O-mannosyl-transferase
MKNPDSFLTRHREAVFVVLLAALVLLSYRAALFVYFLSDDFSIIGKFLEHKSYYFSFSDFFRPLPLLDLWLDTQFFGLRPWLFRLSSLALHTLNAYLVYRLALLLLENRQTHLAYISGILFAVLASHSETVIWIACRPDLLATLFCLLCLITYLRWLRSSKHTDLFFSALFFLLAFLSKESAYALPLLLLVFTAIHEAPLTAFRNIKKYRLAIVLFTAGLIVQFVLRFVATQALLGGEASLVNTTAPYLYNLFAFTCRTLLFPLSSESAASAISDHALLLALVTTLVVAAGLWKADARARKIALLMLAAYVAALLPVLHKTISLYELQIERYTYLPGVFICIFIAVLLGAIADRRLHYPIVFIYAVLLIFFLQASIERWNRASDIALDSLREVKENFHAEKLMVLGLPVSYKGVHIFKNGFPRAVMFFNKVPIRRKYLYTPVILEINEENVKINLTKTDTAFQASINSSVSRLLPGEAIGAYELLTDRENTLSVRYPGIHNNDYQVMVFADGQLRFQ